MTDQWTREAGQERSRITAAFKERDGHNKETMTSSRSKVSGVSRVDAAIVYQEQRVARRELWIPWKQREIYVARSTSGTEG